MSRSGVNQAITQNGEAYNKLKRPDEFPSYTATGAFPKEDTLSTLPQPAESTKRTLDEAGINNVLAECEPENKRSRVSNRHGVQRPMNMDYGMQSMFPGIMDNEDSSDESTNAALAYLRSVRSEAETIPQLLVAPTRTENGVSDRSIYDTGRGDARAFYEDGAYIACDAGPNLSSSESSNVSDELDPQEQYYRRLMWRYVALRETLSHSLQVNSTGMEKQGSSERTASEIPTNRQGWLYVLDREYPTPALVSQLDEYKVFQGLRYCAHSLDRFKAITKQKSCWIWALLAKAPESGTLDYTRAGSIRDLGHKAGQFGMRLRSCVSQLQNNEDEDEEVMEWEVEGDGICKDEEENSNVGDSVKPRNTQSRHSAGSALDAEPEAQVKLGDESDAEMSISEDERDERDADEPTTLEEARARLLAQLGDRLVQPSTKEEVQRKKPFLSRAEAETHRQQLREQDLELKGKVGVEKTPGLQDDEISHREAVYGNTQTNTNDIDFNSKVTIDMILTVVAECYGQKDLLRYRDFWRE